jgi:hypothetical protein
MQFTVNVIKSVNAPLSESRHLHAAERILATEPDWRSILTVA